MSFPRLESYQERKQHDAAGYNTVCPQCGRGFGHAANHNEAREHSWARYIGEDGRPIDARECGMCLHHTSCGYHLPPREYYRRKRDDEARLRPRRRLDKNDTLRYDNDTALRAYDSEKRLNDSTITPLAFGPQRSCDSPLSQGDSHSHRNEVYRNEMNRSEAYLPLHAFCEASSSNAPDYLFSYLAARFGEERVRAVWQRLGITAMRSGATIFWQRDLDGHLRTGKIIRYDLQSGKRDKSRGATWVHALHDVKPLLPADATVHQCLFGLHQLNDENDNENLNDNDTALCAYDTLRYDNETALCAYDSDSEKRLNNSTINRFNRYEVPIGPFSNSPINHFTRHEVPIGPQRSCDSPLGPQSPSLWGGFRRGQSPSGDLIIRLSDYLPSSSPFEKGGVFLTEGEKAAVYGTLLWPQHVWLATGGKQNLKADLLEPLRGYAIRVLPDADALDDWCHAAADLRRQGFDITIPWRWFHLMQTPAHAATTHDLEDVWPELLA